MASLGFLGCHDSRDADTSGTGASSLGDDGAGATSGDADDGETNATDGPDETGGSGPPPIFDIGGGGPTGDPGGGDGCQKIDFLFVIDNSQSMEGEQDNLVASFQGFIDAISETTNAENYHIMVADADWDPSLWTCAKKCQTVPGETCKYDDAIFCADFEEPGAHTCEDSLGVGVVTDQSGQPCPIAGGNRYLVDGQPDLAATFECIARVGIGGDPTEHIMDSMRFAVSDDFNDVGGCHPGFVRDDAILVVTFITDEVPVFSIGTPADWKAALVEAKSGNEAAIVVLGLLGDTNVPNGLCEPKDGEIGAEDTPSLRAFVDMFEHGSWGSVCAPDYSPFFEAAVSSIDTACDEFRPEG